MPVSYDAALALLERHKAELPVANPDEYIENLTNISSWVDNQTTAARLSP
jgi:hypothetical protein